MALAAYIVAGIVVFLLAIVMILALCAAAAMVLGLDEDDLPEPTLLDAIEQVGDDADAVIFDFPQQRPQLVLIAGGRDMGEGAA